LETPGRLQRLLRCRTLIFDNLDSLFERERLWTSRTFGETWRRAEFF